MGTRLRYPGFNRWSQHLLVEVTVAVGSVLRLGFSIRASCVVGRSVRWRRPQGRRRSTSTDRSLADLSLKAATPDPERMRSVHPKARSVAARCRNGYRCRCGRHTLASCRPTSRAEWITPPSTYLLLGRPGGPQLTPSVVRRQLGSIARVVAARLPAVLVVAMIVTSILGFTVLDRQGGNSATAIASPAIGSSSAVLGLLFGFLKAF